MKQKQDFWGSAPEDGEDRFSTSGIWSLSLSAVSTTFPIYSHNVISSHQFSCLNYTVDAQSFVPSDGRLTHSVSACVADFSLRVAAHQPQLNLSNNPRLGIIQQNVQTFIWDINPLCNVYCLSILRKILSQFVESQDRNSKKRSKNISRDQWSSAKWII